MPVIGVGRGEKILTGVGIHPVVPGPRVPLSCKLVCPVPCVAVVIGIGTSY